MQDIKIGGLAYHIGHNIQTELRRYEGRSSKDCGEVIAVKVLKQSTAQQEHFSIWIKCSKIQMNVP